MRCRWLAGVMMLLAACAAIPGARAAGDVPQPQVPRGQGDGCVEETTVMRRSHMTLLSHQRDATVHQGVRTPKHSLNGCVSCHAVAGGDGQPVGFDSPRHFCQSCHSYAAVRIDCFECHSAKPANDAAKAAEARK